MHRSLSIQNLICSLMYQWFFVDLKTLFGSTDIAISNIGHSIFADIPGFLHSLHQLSRDYLLLNDRVVPRKFQLFHSRDLPFLIFGCKMCSTLCSQLAT
jgi:hypothetical protein